MIIPFDRLSPDALQGLIEEYVTRDGTDYGQEEISLATKVAQVRKQLEQQDIVIVFDTALESITLLPRRDAEQYLSSQD